MRRIFVGKFRLKKGVGMPFVSDLQRKWYFSNLATGLFGSAGEREPWSDPGAGFVKMTDQEISDANRARNDGRIYGKFDSSSTPSELSDVLDIAHSHPMPHMSADEKSDFAAYRGEFGKASVSASELADIREIADGAVFVGKGFDDMGEQGVGVTCSKCGKPAFKDAIGEICYVCDSDG